MVEIVLALGVISFALVGIMGLFPVAMKSAQESQRETRATFIAQQIFSDMRVSGGSNRFVISGTNSATTNISLASATNLFLAFNTNGVACTSNSISSPEFSGGYPSASFLASVTVDTSTGVTNLSRVQTTVETPAVAPSANRSKFTFVTLMNY